MFSVYCILIIICDEKLLLFHAYLHSTKKYLWLLLAFISFHSIHMLKFAKELFIGVARPGPTKACALPSTFQALYHHKETRVTWN